ncbi:MAG TPA: electron transport complex subunit RsxB, partial [Gammaproteobacteria bacterium]|nr:electron transport complex subunit RsxB [Gammaproteobacteria bacterium]
MISAIIVIAALATAFGLALGFAAVRFRTQGDPVVDRIDSLLPQTQCGQCSFAG